MTVDTNAEQARPSLEELNWAPEQLEQSLEQVYHYTLHEGRQAMRWYQVNSRPKKRWAQTLRVVAIIGTALGGIIPILSQILTTAEGITLLNPAWASVAIALAAAGLGLDRFFGLSTAWMRFVTSELKLQAMLQAFQYDWEYERMAWQGERPNYEQARAMLQRCATFADEVAAVVEQETQQWVQEFQSALRQLDESIRSQADLRERTRPGAIAVAVDNGDQCDNGWELSVEGRGSQSQRGTSAVVNNVPPGLWRVVARGEIAGRPVQAEAAVKVTAGEVTSVTMTLS